MDTPASSLKSSRRQSHPKPDRRMTVEHPVAGGLETAANGRTQGFSHSLADERPRSPRAGSPTLILHSKVRAAKADSPCGAEVGIAAMEYIERLHSMDEPLKIQEVFADTLATLGITNFALLEFAADPEAFKNRVINDRMPQEWSERYFEQKFVEVDPVISEVLTNTEPFLWSEAIAKGQGEKRQRRIFNEAAEFHLNAGICIPIFGPQRYMAWVTLAGAHLDLGPAARAAVHVMALYTHNRLIKLVRSKKSDGPALTRREADCLRWVAQGKSDWEIGSILNISESTAHWYVESAKRKIGVATRMQAVVGAIAEGVIHV